MLKQYSCFILPVPLFIGRDFNYIKLHFRELMFPLDSRRHMESLPGTRMFLPWFLPWLIRVLGDGTRFSLFPSWWGGSERNMGIFGWDSKTMFIAVPTTRS